MLSKIYQNTGKLLQHPILPSGFDPCQFPVLYLVPDETLVGLPTRLHDRSNAITRSMPVFVTALCMVIMPKVKLIQQRSTSPKPVPRRRVASYRKDYKGTNKTDQQNTFLDRTPTRNIIEIEKRK